jgi:hypothetical protein
MQTATPDGKASIIDHSNGAQLFRVQPRTGCANEILVDAHLDYGFPDGIAMSGRTAMLTRVHATQVAGIFILATCRPTSSDS